MSAYFTINFRREAYQREVARTRRRLFALGTWVAYFGALAVLLGLYGLNCSALTRRAAAYERQAARLQAQGSSTEWQVAPEQLTVVEAFKANPPEWRDRLVRLAQLLPQNMVLTSLAVNPDNLSSPADQRRFVISGELRTSAGGDRMRPVAQLVSTLRADSVFARGYPTIRLASSQTLEAPATVTVFTIECR
jgi:hypothetical protein